MLKTSLQPLQHVYKPISQSKPTVHKPTSPSKELPTQGHCSKGSDKLRNSACRDFEAPPQLQRRPAKFQRSSSEVPAKSQRSSSEAPAKFQRSSSEVQATLGANRPQISGHSGFWSRKGLNFSPKKGFGFRFANLCFCAFCALLRVFVRFCFHIFSRFEAFLCVLACFCAFLRVLMHACAF